MNRNQGMNQKKYIATTLMAALAVFAIVSASSLMSAVEATHTTEGAAFWLSACNAVQSMIAEPCGTLVSNHDPYGQGLSTDGWRVAKCVAGGALVVYAGHPELVNLGPVVGCASNTNTNTANTNTANTIAGISNLLQGLMR